MAKSRMKHQENEERRHQGAPEGLVVTASKNKAFAERLIGVIRLAMATSGVNRGRR